MGSHGSNGERRTCNPRLWFESRLRQELSTTEVRPLSKASISAFSLINNQYVINRHANKQLVKVGIVPYSLPTLFATISVFNFGS